MKRILIISGSPRKGNSEFILDKIYKDVDGEKELILLRNENIKHCSGCLFCDKHKRCAIQDDMQEIYKKMLKVDVFIVGTPNYFDSVPGLMKDFIDRTNPFFETNKLKGKKLITIVVGGGKIQNSKRVGRQILKYFSDSHQLRTVGRYYFQALHCKDIEKNPKAATVINKIVNKINSIE